MLVGLGRSMWRGGRSVFDPVGRMLYIMGPIVIVSLGIIGLAGGVRSASLTISTNQI